MSKQINATHTPWIIRELDRSNVDNRANDCVAEMLEALRALLDWGRDNTSPVDANSPHALLVRACEVIAKATEGK